MCTIKQHGEEYDMRKYLWDINKQEDTGYNGNMKKKLQNICTSTDKQNI